MKNDELKKPIPYGGVLSCPYCYTPLYIASQEKCHRCKRKFKELEK